MSTVTINGSTWQVYFADQPADLMQGLSGLVSMDAGTGMLFDTGYSHLIGVTTVQMLFSLDIAFISSDLKVVEIQRDVAPGNIITSTESARYFLEVNAGELAAISVGDDVDVNIVVPVFIGDQTEVTIDDIWAVITTMMPMLVVGMFGIGLIRSMSGGERHGLVY